MKVLFLAGYKNGTPGKLKTQVRGANILNPYKSTLERFKNKTKGTLLINWGTRLNQWQIRLLSETNKLNCQPSATDTAIHKALTLKTLERAGVPCIEHTESLPVAVKWLEEGRSVFGRSLLRSSGGEGIVLAQAKEYALTGKFPEAFSHCKLFTRNFPKDQELRVHVFNGKVIDYVAKRRRRPKPDETGAVPADSIKPNFWIRSHGNGWVFCHNDDEGKPIKRNHNAEQVAVDAVKALGLNFGAVDVLVGGRGNAVVCEVNTAPGLEDSTTIKAYVDAITEYQKLLEKAA